jgi:hypothetical protein
MHWFMLIFLLPYFAFDVLPFLCSTEEPSGNRPDNDSRSTTDRSGGIALPPPQDTPCGGGFSHYSQSSSSCRALPFLPSVVVLGISGVPSHSDTGHQAYRNPCQSVAREKADEELTWSPLRYTTLTPPLSLPCPSSPRISAT